MIAPTTQAWTHFEAQSCTVFSVLHHSANLLVHTHAAQSLGTHQGNEVMEVVVSDVITITLGSGHVFQATDAGQAKCHVPMSEKLSKTLLHNHLQAAASGTSLSSESCRIRYA